METTCPPGGTSPGCNEHPSAPVVARCVSCGRLMCAYCRLVYGNKNYCKSCLDRSRVSAPAPLHYHPDPGYPPPHGYPSQGPPPGYGPPPPPGAWTGGPPPPYYGYPPPPIPYRPARPVVFEGTPWGVGEAVIIFGIAFVAASILSVLVYTVLKSAFATTTAAFLLIFFSRAILSAFLLAGTFSSVKVRHGSHLSALGLRLEGLGKGVGWGIAVGLPLFVAAILVSYIVTKLFGPTNTDMVSNSVNKISGGGISPYLILLLAFTLVVLAPVCEEIFFRGYLYPALRNRMDKQPAMIVNGLLFAAAHFELIGFLPRFLLGWGLCYIYERNRTLGAPITGHSIYNGLILFLALFFRL